MLSPNDLDPFAPRPLAYETSVLSTGESSEDRERASASAPTDHPLQLLYASAEYTLVIAQQGQ